MQGFWWVHEKHAVLGGKAGGMSCPRFDSVSLNANQITQRGGARVNGGHMHMSVTQCERGGVCTTQAVQETLDITRRGSSSDAAPWTFRRTIRATSSPPAKP